MAAGGAALLAELVGFAAADSVNPCTFYIYAVMLLSVSVKTRSPRRVAAAAAAFIAGVYVGYTLLGLGVSWAAAAAPLWLLATAAIGYGLFTLASAAADAAGRRIPLAHPGGRLAPLAVRGSASVAAAAGLGLLLSFTLLPCSGGPLFAFIAAARGAGVSGLSLLPYLLVYNLVFVAPLAAIGAAAAAAYRARRVQEAVARHAALVEAVAGLMLVGVGVYLLHSG